MTAPVIGLTTYGRFENNFQTTHYSEWFAIPTLYVDAVRRAGGVPRAVPQRDIPRPGRTVLHGGRERLRERWTRGGDSTLSLRSPTCPAEI